MVKRIGGKNIIMECAKALSGQPQNMTLDNQSLNSPIGEVYLPQMSSQPVGNVSRKLCYQHQPNNFSHEMQMEENDANNMTVPNTGTSYHEYLNENLDDGELPNFSGDYVDQVFYSSAPPLDDNEVVTNSNQMVVS